MLVPSDLKPCHGSNTSPLEPPWASGTRATPGHAIEKSKMAKNVPRMGRKRATINPSCADGIRQRPHVGSVASTASESVAAAVAAAAAVVVVVVAAAAVALVGGGGGGEGGGWWLVLWWLWVLRRW